jgi:dTDP-4-amino-4,6-dideoxygalactose transaminase
METKQDLAVFGAPPAFEEPLHVGRPNIGDRARLFERLNDLLDRRWLTNNGHYVQELEKRLASFLGVDHCIAVCNATVGLEIAIRALDLKGEVVVPSFSFVATAHALQWQEIVPVFCDIDPDTHTLNAERIPALLTPRTTGIIGVHVWGRPCDTQALSEVAETYRLRLLYDAAHAFGCSHRGRMVGGFGDAEVFSFHATKMVNSFEGGAITTNDADLAERIRLMKNFGFSGYDNVIYLGTNGKMSEPAAAMGLTSMESTEEFITANRRNHGLYSELLAPLAGLDVIGYDEVDGSRSNYQYVVLDVDESSAGITRDQLLSVLWAENVMARRYFHPGCHRMEPYRSFYPHSHLLLPETEKVTARVLQLPTGTSVDPPIIHRVSEIIRRALAEAPSIREGLEGQPADLRLSIVDAE